LGKLEWFLLAGSQTDSVKLLSLFLKLLDIYFLFQFSVNLYFQHIEFVVRFNNDGGNDNSNMQIFVLL